MKTLFLPMYRMAVSYTVNFGRRWSVLEQLLLIEISASRRTARELSDLTDMPDRLVIEALINLMRASWVEVRSTDSGVFFTATTAGRRRATEEKLPETLEREIKWLSVCWDRLTGSWLRAEDLDLVYERDLPPDAQLIEPTIHTYDPNDASLWDLFILNREESLEPSTPVFKTPSKPYARISVAFGNIEDGLPQYASMRLKDALLAASKSMPDGFSTGPAKPSETDFTAIRDTLTEADIIVGGGEHKRLLQHALDNAKSTVIVHSCFINPDTVKALLPDLARAARRKIRVELLWGLNTDPEADDRSKPVSETLTNLNGLPEAIRALVQLSPLSSASHAKVLMYDDSVTGGWVTVIGSCNFLSTEFDWTEASLRSRSQRLAAQVMARLIAAQLPSAGSWSPVARRLSRIWSELRRQVGSTQENGTHSLTLLMDQDHYGCVTRARDLASSTIAIGCDLYGVAAETSVLVPMSTAAEKNCSVSLFYCRPSKRLLEEGRAPDTADFKKRGISIKTVSDFHAKFLTWDDSALAITSFNWMSTVVDGGRARGSEIGLLAEGPGLGIIFARQLKRVTNGAVEILVPDQD